jgi:hypothetical protein
MGHIGTTRSLALHSTGPVQLYPRGKEDVGVYGQSKQYSFFSLRFRLP